MGRGAIMKWVVFGISNGCDDDIIGFYALKSDCVTPENFIDEIIEEYGAHLELADVAQGWLVEFPNYSRIYDHATPNGQEAWVIFP